MRRCGVLPRGKECSVEMNSKRQEFALEQDRFAKTLAIVAEERKKAEIALGMADGEDRFIQTEDDGSNEAEVQLFVTRMRLRMLHQLRLSEKAPYFARVDFVPAGGQQNADAEKNEGQPVYIGRWGIIKTPEYKVCVADWRSPIANLYYCGQAGPVRYDAPDGAIEGELLLKRMFGVENGTLLSMQDTGVVGQEKYLTDALSKVATARLREVVTTIQAEQNLIIRYNSALPLCVQGVAGSGKTTIALHRIAWMLYHLQKSVQPQQMMILAPNPLFLDYISRVLPDLGVQQVRQATFAQLCKQLLGKRMPSVVEGARLEARFSMTKAERDALDGVLRRKGSLALGHALDLFLTTLEQSLMPQGDILFGGRVLLGSSEMSDLFLRQLRHFPLEARIGEVRKAVRTRLKGVIGAAGAALERITEEKLSELLRTLPDGEMRRARATALLRSRDERLGQLKTAEKDFWSGYDASWNSVDLLTVYAQFWQEMAEKEEEFLSVWEATKPLILRKKAASEDLPALLWLGQRLYGCAHLDNCHIVIDEAQDVSPLQVKVLQKMAGHDAFTLVGDLWQGIYGDEGIRSWEDLCEGVFDTVPQVAALTVSYRSTVEIMQLAFHITARHPIPGLAAAKPVLRHGPRPSFLAAANEGERIDAIADAVRNWEKEGFFSIALIVKKEADAKKLHKRLEGALAGARLVSRGDDAFAGGVQVLAAGMVKGLEFDCVLIADAQNAVYPDEPFYAKMLYVLCTRPLHRLMMIGKSGEAFAHVDRAHVAEAESEALKRKV